MKITSTLFAGLVFGALLALSLTHATAAETPRDPLAPLARAINALVDTISETDPTFRERFLKKLEVGSK